MLDTNRQQSKEISEISDNDDVLEHFIPITEEDIIEDLDASANWPKEDSELFKRVCNMFVVLYHARLHASLRTLKTSYLPFSPDRDTILVKEITDEERARLLTDLMQSVDEVCIRANFEKLSAAAISEAMTKSSPYGVQVHVNLKEFETMRLYFRGAAIRRTKLRSWKWLWLRKQLVEIPIYQRLCVMLKLKEMQKGLRNNQSIDDRCVYIKLFKNIPQHDLEMLFPNSKIKMTLFDKIKMSITGGGGTISGGVAFTKVAVAGAAGPWGLVIAMGAFGAVLWRQIANIFNHRNKYMASLAKNLYFFNLNNNMGALSQLIDMAEGEDTKEALLSYYFLLAFPDRRFNSVALDATIEAYVKTQYGVRIDFEVSDGLRKLDEMGILTTDADGSLKVLGLQETLKLLNDRWDDMYDYK